MRFLAIANYPSDYRPAHQVFVRALLLEMKTLGAEIEVMAPEPIWNAVKVKSGFRLAPQFEVRDGLAVYRPRYTTYSQVTLPGGGSTFRWTVRAYSNAARRQIRTKVGNFDFCFAHFLYPHGYAAVQVARDLRTPAVASLGESEFQRYETHYSRREIRDLLASFSRVITNSPLIKECCVDRYDVPEDRIDVFPNGVNERLFFPRDQELARRKCGLPLQRPIVGFVGQFTDRKGPLRVLEAIRARPEIGAFFLGYGPQTPQGPQVLCAKAVRHEEISCWLSSADIFVLPTLHEGCCNAVLEALSCGVPIVSSDLPFNRGLLDEKVAVLVDPKNIGALKRAIFSLLDNPERLSAMRQACVQKSASFRLADRANQIINLLKDHSLTGEKPNIKTKAVCAAT